MSRPSSGGFILGFAAEIAIVVAVVSLLPKIDLSGGRSLPAADLPPTLVSQPRETSYYEQRASSSPPAPRERAVAQSVPPALREPPPLITVDPSRPAIVERRLDRASQGLVNGLSSYVTRSAESFQRPAPMHSQPPQPNPQTVAPADVTAGSFPTQPVQAKQPRPWMTY